MKRMKTWNKNKQKSASSDDEDDNDEEDSYSAHDSTDSQQGKKFPKKNLEFNSLKEEWTKMK